MSDRFNVVYKNAEAYSDAARLININMITNPPLLIPSIMNAAFALEQYFKALYLILNGLDFKVKGNNSHDFYALLKKIPVDIQLSMEKTFNEKLDEPSRNEARMLMQASKTNIPFDFYENVKIWSNNFVKFRYLYDYEKVGHGMFFIQIMIAVKYEILKLRPDLQS